VEEHQVIDISVDVVVFGFDGNTLKVLLIKQAPPTENFPEEKLQMAVPGDLIYGKDSLDDAANRILKDCTALEGIYLKQFHTFGDPSRVQGLKDQEWLRSFRANPERRVITVSYYSLIKLVDYVPQPDPKSHASQAEWVDVYDIPSLAFDHNNIVTEGLKKLREELNTKHIEFELLPEKFTLSQLQKLYEIILDKKFDKRNFRKNIKKLDHVIPLDEKQTGVLHKPAQLFTYDKEAK
jgi:8-oxo-dGTP diphosphatase